MTFPYFGIPASIVFWGQMYSMSKSETHLSVRLPVTGIHSVVVSSSPTFYAPRKCAEIVFSSCECLLRQIVLYRVSAKSGPCSRQYSRDQQPTSRDEASQRTAGIIQQLSIGIPQMVAVVASSTPWLFYLLRSIFFRFSYLAAGRTRVGRRFGEFEHDGHVRRTICTNKRR